MTEEIKKETAAPESASGEKKGPAGRGSVFKAKRALGRGGRKGGRDERGDDGFEQKIIDIARVTRVMAGGKRMRFRACIALGSKKGKVGLGLAKGADVTMAVNKAVNQAKKNMIDVPLTAKETIPHEVRVKLGAAEMLLKPAAPGTGLIAGGSARMILELAGVKNVISKTLGARSSMNNAKCAVLALKTLKKIQDPKK